MSVENMPITQPVISNESQPSVPPSATTPIWGNPQITAQDILKYGTDPVLTENVYNPISNPNSTTWVWLEQQIDWMGYEESLKHLESQQETEIPKIEFGTTKDFVDAEVSKRYKSLLSEVDELSNMIESQASKKVVQENIDTANTDTVNTEINKEDDSNVVKDKNENSDNNDNNNDWYITLDYTVDEVEDAIKFKKMYENDIQNIYQEKKKIIDYAWLQQENGILAEKLRDLTNENINLKHNTVALQDPIEMSIVNSMRSYQQSWSDNDQYAALKAASNILLKFTNGEVNIESEIGDYFAKKLWVKWNWWKWSNSLGWGNQPYVWHKSVFNEISNEDINKYWL